MQEVCFLWLLLQTVTTPRDKFEALTVAFNTVFTQYNAKPDVNSYNYAVQLRGHIQNTYPTEYNDRKDRGVQNTGADPWDIKIKH